MRYSVFNRSMGTYKIYEGGPILPRLKSGNPSLGAVPEESNDVLPPNSEYLGESEKPEGRIVEKDYIFKNFLLTFVAIVAAGIVSRLIYEKWF